MPEMRMISAQTADQVLDVLEHYLRPDIVLALVEELRERTGGNQSYRATLEVLEVKARQRSRVYVRPRAE